MRANRFRWLLLGAALLQAGTSGAQIIQTLCSFDFTNGAGPNALTLGADGDFYGTTSSGGMTDSTFADGTGTVFQMTTNGTLNTLAYFDDWAYTGAALTLGDDGDFYGTTPFGGIKGIFPLGWGTVFKVTTSGTLTTLASFVANADGAFPVAPLTIGSDGSFYGTAQEGGSSNLGTVFGMTTNGALTALASFNGTNGANPYAGLTLGNDGNFYGTTGGGGSGNYGTVFRVTTNGTLTTLASFNFTNGASPSSALTLGSDGSFYGTTDSGGITNATFTDGMGTVFHLATNGVLTTLFAFNFTNGAYPSALTLGADGNFYGTTSSGGITNSAFPDGMGTVFQMTTNGTLSLLASCNFTNGANPSALTPGSDGNLYGTTGSGGTTNFAFGDGMGTVFRLVLMPVIAVQPQNQTNGVGAIVSVIVNATGLNPVGYQWQKNGTNLVNGGNISGANTSALSITDISDSDAASYCVIVNNSYGTVTSSNAALTVVDLPFIASQPQSQTVGLGSNATFNVTVYGAPPFVFQWYFNTTPVGSPTTGTNYSSYALTNVGTNQAGNYSVEVFNGYGSLISSNAVLTVKVFPPIIGLQPLSQSVMMGGNASFSVSASGTAPLHYQWQFNGTNLPSATNTAYAIQSVSATNTGNYSVVVTNSAGSVTSANALLTVIVPPTMSLQFLAGYPLLSLGGMLSSNFVVQYNTNLAGTDWVILLSLTNLASSPYQFLDPAGDGEPARFYRAFMR